MADTKIEWAEKTWNPVTGCSPISEGCANCYAKRMANRVRGRCGYPEDEPFRVTLHEDKLEEPYTWKKPRRVFVCSMGDLFHEDVPAEFIAKVWSMMWHCAPQWWLPEDPIRTMHGGHIFQVLTKRADRMASLLSDPAFWRRVVDAGCLDMRRVELEPVPHIWLGVTAENQARADERIPTLLQIPAAVRFVSVEPMLGPVDIRPYLPAEHWCFCGYVGDEIGTDYCTNCEKEFGDDGEGGNTCVHCGHGEYDSACPECGDIDSFGLWDTGPLDIRPSRLDWVICGGESGHGARPIHPDWVRSLRDQCVSADVPFFFKQWGEWAPWGDDNCKYLMEFNCDQAAGKFKSSVMAPYVFYKVGKKRASRLLDGRVWLEYPHER